MTAPDRRRILEKLAASILVWLKAMRHSKELAAKATIETAVSKIALSTIGLLLYDQVKIMRYFGDFPLYLTGRGIQPDVYFARSVQIIRLV